MFKRTIIACAALLLIACGQQQGVSPINQSAPGVTITRLNSSPGVYRIEDTTRGVECYVVDSNGIWCHEVQR